MFPAQNLDTSIIEVKTFCVANFILQNLLLLVWLCTLAYPPETSISYKAEVAVIFSYESKERKYENEKLLWLFFLFLKSILSVSLKLGLLYAK